MKSVKIPELILNVLCEYGINEYANLAVEVLDILCGYCCSGFDPEQMSENTLGNYSATAQALAKLAVPLIDEVNFIHREE